MCCVYLEHQQNPCWVKFCLRKVQFVIFCHFQSENGRNHIKFAQFAHLVPAPRKNHFFFMEGMGGDKLYERTLFGLPELGPGEGRDIFWGDIICGGLQIFNKKWAMFSEVI